MDVLALARAKVPTNVGETRDFLATQARRATAPTGGKANIRRSNARDGCGGSVRVIPITKIRQPWKVPGFWRRRRALPCALRGRRRTDRSRDPGPGERPTVACRLLDVLTIVTWHVDSS